MRNSVRRIRIGRNEIGDDAVKELDELVMRHPELKAFQKELSEELGRLSPENRIEFLNQLLQEKLNHLMDALESLEGLSAKNSRNSGNSDIN